MNSLDQPRSQFLQIGYYFALLLSLRQAVKATYNRMGESPLSELIHLITSIINIAMETADERTQHLTDNIYHIVTFSAIMLCQLIRKYEHQLHNSHDVPALDYLVSKLAVWLKSIGLRCHVAHMLGDLVSAQQRTLRPRAGGTPSENSVFGGILSPNTFFPDIISAEMLEGEIDLWPPWDQVF